MLFRRKKTQPSKPQASATAVSKAMKNVNVYHRELTPEELAKDVHRTEVGGMWDEVGRLQIEFLQSRGLRPEHKLCDVGCGALRGGVHFVRYLDAGNYYGLDINASLLEGGRKELEQAGIADKQAHLLLDDKFQASRFGAKFDYMLAVSVFTHLFGNHIVRCLGEARKALAPQGQFFATFFQAPAPVHLEPITQEPGGIVTLYDHDPFHYSAEEMEAMARLAGLKMEVIGNWNHPRNQRMLAFTPA